jgi:adenylosuccinate synthase
MPGWKESTVGIKEFDRLPSNAKSYIKKIESLLKTPIQIISTGPKRDEIIVLDGQF